MGDFVSLSASVPKNHMPEVSSQGLKSESKNLIFTPAFSLWYPSLDYDEILLFTRYVCFILLFVAHLQLILCFYGNLMIFKYGFLDCYIIWFCWICSYLYSVWYIFVYIPKKNFFFPLKLIYPKKRQLLFLVFFSCNHCRDL